MKGYAPEQIVAKLLDDVCHIDKGGTAKWIAARVKVFQGNIGFKHDAANGSDVVFSGSIRTRSIRFTFDALSKRK